MKFYFAKPLPAPRPVVKRIRELGKIPVEDVEKLILSQFSTYLDSSETKKVVKVSIYSD
jgi:hypothetical protein